jgi:hypothetical protein
MFQLHIVCTPGSPNAAPVSGRRRSHNSSEYSSEVALITKPNFLADARDGFLSVRQLDLRAFNAVVIQIFHERKAGNLFEETHEMGDAHTAYARCLPYLDCVSTIVRQMAK